MDRLQIMPPIPAPIGKKRELKKDEFSRHGPSFLPDSAMLVYAIRVASGTSFAFPKYKMKCCGRCKTALWTRILMEASV